MLDLRFALRSLARARGFAIAVILTLALGIGANTAIFSVVRGVMLKPLPHRDGDKLMFLRQSVEANHQENVAFSVPEINDFRQQASSFSGIAEYSPITLTLLGEHDAVRIDLGLVTGNYFSVMGLSPVNITVLRTRSSAGAPDFSVKNSSSARTRSSTMSNGVWGPGAKR